MSVTSDYYRERAADCGREAEAATLDNVRERCLRAQAAWLAMANRIGRSEAFRAQAAATKAAPEELTPD